MLFLFLLPPSLSQLFIALTTTTTEVLRSVVEQIQKARVEKGLAEDYHGNDDLSDYYIVALSGNKEWILPSGFNPLQLQNQASKCMLMVRRRSEEQRLDEQATTV